MKNFTLLNFLNQIRNNKFIYQELPKIAPKTVTEKPRTAAEQEKAELDKNTQKLSNELRKYQANINLIKTNPDPKIKALAEEFDKAYTTAEKTFNSKDTKQADRSHSINIHAMVIEHLNGYAEEAKAKNFMITSPSGETIVLPYVSPKYIKTSLFYLIGPSGAFKSEGATGDDAQVLVEGLYSKKAYELLQQAQRFIDPQTLCNMAKAHTQETETPAVNFYRLNYKIAKELRIRNINEDDIFAITGSTISSQQDEKTP